MILFVCANTVKDEYYKELIPGTERVRSGVKESEWLISGRFGCMNWFPHSPDPTLSICCFQLSVFHQMCIYFLFLAYFLPVNLDFLYFFHQVFSLLSEFTDAQLLLGTISKCHSLLERKCTDRKETSVHLSLGNLIQIFSTNTLKPRDTSVGEEDNF